MTKRKRYNRRYLGTIVTHSNYREILDNEGADKVKFHKKHLAAYIKGKNYFFHGFTVPEDPSKQPRPIMHYVESEFTEK